MRFVALVSAVFLSACGAPVVDLPLVDGGSGGGSGGAGGGMGAGGSGGGAALSSDGGSTLSTSCVGAAPSSGCPMNSTYECVNTPQGPKWQCSFTPLVLSFDAAPVTFAPGEARFDLGSGEPVSSDWPTAVTPWLALDRNHDGTINDATELFGSAVRLSTGALASNGFEALAELDGNRDGRVDAKDPGFPQLKMWADRDGNRQADKGELTQARVVSIELAYRIAPACDARGNCAVERAAFTWADARGKVHRGEVVDVHLAVRPEAPPRLSCR